MRKRIIYCILLFIPFLNSYAQNSNEQVLLKQLNDAVSTLGESHPNSIAVLKELSQFYKKNEEIGKAIEIQKMVVEACKHTYTHLSNAYIEEAANLGWYLYANMDYKESSRVMQEVIDLYPYIEEGSGKDYYLMALHFLGLSYSKMSLHFKAIEVLKTCVSQVNHYYGSNSITYANALLVLSICYRDYGNYIDAIEYSKKASMIIEKLEGKNCYDYMGCLNVMSLCYETVGEIDKAIECAKELLSIDNTVFGKVSNAHLYNLGTYYITKRDLTNAESVLQDALKFCLQSGDHQFAIKSFICLGLVSFLQKDYTKFKNLTTQALEYQMKYVPYDEEMHTPILDNLITAYFHLNEPEKAKPYVQEYYKKTVEIITNNFPMMTTQERYYFWRSRIGKIYCNIPRIASELNDDEMCSLAYDSQLMAKGLLLSAEIEFSKVIKDSKDDDLIRLYNIIKENKKDLDKLKGIEPSMRTMDVDSLREVIENQEIALIGKSKEYGDFAKSLRVKWKDVQKNLKEGDIAVEFVAFVHRLDGPQKYYALTLKKNSSPKMIYLCDSLQIANVSSNEYYKTTDLYRLIWKPLESELHGIDRVFFSTSGLLHTIGIEYLNVDNKKRMCDSYELYRLTSTREVAFKEEQSQINKAVLFGGLDYDANLNNDNKETGNTGQTETILGEDREIIDANLFRGGVGYLEGTKYEVETIGGILDNEKVNYKIFSETEGTEDSIKKLSGKKCNLLHIATHGFFLSSFPSRENAKTKNESNLTKEELALNRSGLLMAGANRFLQDKYAPDNTEDGILTAKEISQLDFREMNMVVLSACETGVGYGSPEGVYGLQRGFKKAGAKILIMSLWKVHDEATLILMSEFYNNLSKGLSVNKSLRNAQRFLRTFNEGQYDDPKYWAAFIILDAI